MLVVKLVLAVAQHERRLSHAAFPQQHHLERVRSARCRPAAAGRSHPARRPPKPGAASSSPNAAAEPSQPRQTQAPRHRPAHPGRRLHSRLGVRPGGAKGKSENVGAQPPRQAPELRWRELLLRLPLMASPSSYVTFGSRERRGGGGHWNAARSACLGMGGASRASSRAAPDRAGAPAGRAGLPAGTTAQ